MKPTRKKLSLFILFKLFDSVLEIIIFHNVHSTYQNSCTERTEISNLYTFVKTPYPIEPGQNINLVLFGVFINNLRRHSLSTKPENR